MEEDHDYELFDRLTKHAETAALILATFTIIYVLGQLIRWYFFLR